MPMFTTVMLGSRFVDGWFHKAETIHHFSSFIDWLSLVWSSLYFIFYPVFSLHSLTFIIIKASWLLAISVIEFSEWIQEYIQKLLITSSCQAKQRHLSQFIRLKKEKVCSQFNKTATNLSDPLFLLISSMGSYLWLWLFCVDFSCYVLFYVTCLF